MPIHHVLKDGSDSQGIPIASIRVYVNIGMCGSYWIERLWNPFQPDVPQKPFEMAVASQQFPEWTETLKRLPALEAYLATYTPMHLEKAEGGKYKGDLVIPDAYKTGTDEQKARWKIVERGQVVFAENCAFCHSSKQPESGDDRQALDTLKAFLVSGNGQEDDAAKQAREKVKAYFRPAVARTISWRTTPSPTTCATRSASSRSTRAGRWRATRSPGTSGSSSPRPSTRPCRRSAR